MLVAATARMLVAVLGLRLRLRVRLLRLWWWTRFGARLRMKLLTRRLLRLRLRTGFRMQLRRLNFCPTRRLPCHRRIFHRTRHAALHHHCIRLTVSPPR
jgi:hypothetical protein